MLKKLDVYIIKQFLGTFFFSIALIITIAIVFDFSEKIDNFIDKEAPIKAIFLDYYLNFIPYFANLFSFLFTFIAVIYFTSRMANRSETVAIRASGVSFARFLRPYFISAFIIAVISFFLSALIIPKANSVRLDFEEKYIRGHYYYSDRNIHKQVQPGTFIYMESYNNRVDIGYNFSIEHFEDGKLKRKLMSDYIKWDSTKNKWTIHNYYIRHIKGNRETLEKGARKDTTLRIQPKEFKRRLNFVETMTLGELDDYIDEQYLRGNSHMENFLIEKHKRIAFPFSSFILTLIGASLASRRVKGGTGAHIGLGIALSFTYILFMQVSFQFAIGGTMSPLLAVWIPNIIFGIVAGILYYRTPQ